MQVTSLFYCISSFRYEVCHRHNFAECLTLLVRQTYFYLNLVGSSCRTRVGRLSMMASYKTPLSQINEPSACSEEARDCRVRSKTKNCYVVPVRIIRTRGWCSGPGVHGYKVLRVDTKMFLWFRNLQIILSEYFVFWLQSKNASNIIILEHFRNEEL